MFKRVEKKEICELEYRKMFDIIHEDLVNISEGIKHTRKSKRDQDLYKRLTGFRDAILLEACSGLGYIYQGNFYKNVTDIKDIDIEDEDVPVDRVISTDYLIHMLNKLLEK